MARLTLPLSVGLVGTGFAAKPRAETLLVEPRTKLIAVAGHTWAKTQEFAQKYQVEPLSDWLELLQRDDIDLVIIANINSLHGAIARQALLHHKHVIIEYPLALDVAEAEEIINLAKSKNLLLHIEHIEILGGLHQALREYLPQIGQVFYARYSTINPQNPAPQKWTYQADLFGFPLMGALSRIQRFTDLFGAVESVNCQARFWGHSQYYHTCMCNAQLKFKSGLIAEVIYGKGENMWSESRSFEVHGEKGALIFDGDRGKLITKEETKIIELGTRRGLFAKDTTMFLDHLLEGKPLYITAEQSLYALKVAEAAKKSAEIGQVIKL